MSVPAGYKVTEAGVIPEDWDAVPLGSLFTFKNGLNKAKQFFGHGTPIVNYMDVFRYPALRMTKVAGRVAVNKSELDSYSVRQGDVFFTRTSETVEEVGIASTMLDVAENTVFSGFVLRARPKGDELIDQFKAYAFRSEAVRNQIIAKASYTTRALTNGGSLSAIYLAKPTKAEQAAIAEALLDMDEAIAAQEAVIAKKRALKTATMQALFSGTRRLPGFSGEWETKLLGQLGVFSKGQGISRAQVATTGLPCVRYGEIYTRHSDVIRAFYSHIPLSVAQQSKRLTKGDLLFTGSGESAAEIGKCVAFVGDEDVYAGGDIVILSPKIGDSIFLGYFLNSAKVVEQKVRWGQGDAVVHIGSRALGQIELKIPCAEEQSAIATVCIDMDAELAIESDNLTKLRRLKTGMMQQLLTGKIGLV